MHVCVCMCSCIGTIAGMSRSEGNLRLGFSFQHVGLDWTHSMRLGDKYFNSISSLAGHSNYILFPFLFLGTDAYHKII